MPFGFISRDHLKTPHTVVAIQQKSTLMAKPLKISPWVVSTSQRRRKVRFEKEVRVYEIKRTKDMTAWDMLWYSQKQIKNARQSIKRSLQNASKTGKRWEDGNHTFRGLEGLTKEGSFRKKQNRLDAIDAVLDEQDRQYILGIRDSIEIARVYQMESEHCAKDARDQGFLDEKYVIDQIS
mmetsp:Transcript_33937/g.78266  ORF Transcript_33937/g.78266 Transcript_33937/m.78266 type:complete len:180 (-) Transcript_33937:28-567(-)